MGEQPNHQSKGIEATPTVEPTAAEEETSPVEHAEDDSESIKPYRITPEGIALYNYAGYFHAFDPETGVPGEGDSEEAALRDWDKAKAFLDKYKEDEKAADSSGQNSTGVGS